MNSATRAARRSLRERSSLSRCAADEAQVGYDEDVALEPFIYLWRPDPKNDNRRLRSVQAYTWPLLYSTLFLYWRYDSIR